MKRLLFLFAMVALTMTCDAQAYLWVGTGNYTSTANPTAGHFPLFSTKKDTVATTGVDSLSLALHSGYATSTTGGDVSSITYTINCWKTSLATTVDPIVQFSLYGSANYGVSYDPTPLLTFSLTPTNSYSVTPKTRTYMINPSKGGNPFTDYIWQATGNTTSTWSWNSDVLIR